MLKSAFEKFIFITFGVILMGAALFTSCHTNLKEPSFLDAPTQNIADLGSDIEQSGADLKTTTETIRENANQGMEKTPDDAKPILVPHWTSIITATGVQDQIVKNLENMTVKAAEAERKSEEYESAYLAEVERRKKAEDSVTKGVRKQYATYSGILFFISLICGGLAIFSKGNKLLLYGSLLAGAGAAVCIFIVQTIALIPWVVGGFGLLALGLVIYTLFFKDKNIKKLDQATKELVETVEAAKPRMTMAGRHRMFGDGPGKGDAYSIQSRETEELVKEIRNQIEKAPKTPTTVAVDLNGDGIIDEDDVPTIISPQKTATRLTRKKVVLH